MRLMPMALLLPAMLWGGDSAEAGWRLRGIARESIREGRPQDALRTLGHLVDLRIGYDPANDTFSPGVMDKLPGFQALVARAATHTPSFAGSRLAFSVADPDLIPEGLAYDPVDRCLYMGCIPRHKILRMTLEGGVTEFVSSGQDGLREPLGVRVDTKRRLLWVTSNASAECGVMGFDLKTGQLRHKAMMPKTGNVMNDLVVTPKGDVLVTDSKGNRLYRLPSGGTRLEPMDLRVSGPNGLSLSEDGRALFIAETGTGILRVDLATMKAEPLGRPTRLALRGIDGLYTQGQTLIAVQNWFTPTQVVRYHLDRTLRRVKRVEILDRRNPVCPLPTTGAIAGGWFYFMANTQVDRMDRSEEGLVSRGASLEPIRIHKVKLKMRR